MDSVVHAAVEEICSQGVNGIHLSDLWPCLLSPLTAHGIHPCDNVKQVLWTNLLNIPGLLFQSNGTFYDSTDSRLQSVVQCEKLKLTIAAVEKLRNCSVGVYDVKAADATNLSVIQRRTLERLACARNAGIMQSELAKEFNMKGNNLFYVLRQLECRGLIVRQSAIVKTKESKIEGEFRNGSTVHTNMLYLRRYAKNLGFQQRLEIIKEDRLLDFNDALDGSPDAIAEGSIKEDVQINDYLPALKAICDKLEQANGKVLVVADIKCELGYKLQSGHRAWRNMCKRLKDASVIEEFYAKVDNKDVNCLRLLKSFSPSKFEQKTFGSRENDVDASQPISLTKRGQITEQLMELPIEHQVYDMVDAEGPKGLAITDIIKRLGVNNKRYYTRLLNMFSRFGMHLQAENHNRCVAYRVWTHKNFNSDASKWALISSENVTSENVCCDLRQSDNSLGWELAPNKSVQINKNIKNIKNIEWVEKTNNLIEQELPNESPFDDLSLVSFEPASDLTPEKTSVLSVSTGKRRRCYKTYPCLTKTSLNIQREEVILQRLEVEKFVIRAELHRHLDNLEGEKHKTMDRKTLDRCLIKLQQEGHCKCIRVSVPAVTNCSGHKRTDVILHPSVQDVSPELLSQIHEKLMSYEIEIRSQASSRLKSGKTFPVLDSIQRIDSSRSPIQSGKSETMRANGYVSAKLVRSKLLHKHLWSYVSSINQGHDPHSTFRLFPVDEIIKAFPLELFLQIVGSTQTFDGMIEKCKKGLHLGGLPKEEYNNLMDTNAEGRLALVIGILRRLKLIRLVEDEHPKEQPLVATLTYALELKPYIEEPVQIFISSIPHDKLQPETRHDFVLSSEEAVDEYWNTLEYIYATADPKTALHAFPGSAVHEICNPRSWSLVRVMTADQREKLLEHIVNADSNKKLLFVDCEKIAKELDLTIEQVLRVSHDKNQKRLTRLRGQLNDDGGVLKEAHKGDDASSSKRRKRNSDRKSRKRVKKGNSDRPSSEQVLTGPHVTESHPTEVQSLERDLHERQDEDGLDVMEDIGTYKENEGVMSLSTQKRKKFSWTEESERQLVIEYVRYRAALGAKFHRTDWGSLPNLPAPPKTCKRRMTIINFNLKIRRCIMRLCNMLSECYAKHMEKLKSNQDIDNVMDASDKVESKGKLNTLERWDDFDNEAIKMALDEILKFREIARQNSPEKDALDTREDMGSCGDRTTISRRRSRSQRFTQKYMISLESGTSSYRRVHESLAASNAVELFKLVFMSTSVAPGVQKLLAETLRRYSKDDLFVAFNFLREKKAMVGGTAGNPFNLSQHFVQSISSSPFPVNTGRRAAKFSNWLREKENDLMEDEIDLSADLQCGDIFQLCALLFREELSIIPNLPDNGVGEANDSRKRKSENSDSGIDDNVKRYKSSTAGEGEIISRREKGFPGIRLSVTRSTISGTNAMHRYSVHHSGISHSDNMKDSNEHENINLIANASSPWEAMTSYANHLFQLPNEVAESIFNPELFRTVHLAIQKAGDQGLSIDEVSEVVNLKEALSEIIIEVLEAFGQALKVNAYNSVHVVDSLYSSKYLLASVAKADAVSLQSHPGVYDKENSIVVSECHEGDVTNTTGESMNADTTLIISKVSQLSETPQVRSSSHVQHTYYDQNAKNNTLVVHHDNAGMHRLILPWLNGDSTVNQIFYKGYQRRLLGIVIQNPGILEDDIVKRMSVLNPQSCKSLLKLMILDNYIIVRKMLESSSEAAPSILNRLIGNKFKRSKLTYIEHFFANPMSCTLL